MLTRTALLLLCLFTLSGCWVADLATRNVDLDQAKSGLASAERALATVRGVVDEMKTQLAQARAAFEATKSEQAAKIVAQFERAAAAAEAQLPLVQGAVDQAKTVVADLEANAGSSVPLWKVALAALVPFVPKLLALIPGVGPALAPLAGVIANGLWAMGATKDQKRQDTATEAAAAALPHQVAVTHEALKLLPPATARDLKADAALTQERAGVIDVIRPLVLDLEIADRAKFAV